MRVAGALVVLALSACGEVKEATQDAAPTPDAPDPVLSITTSGNGVGSITANGATIDCGSTCTASVPRGTSVTLTAAADSRNSTFMGWSGVDCPGVGECTFTVDGDTTVNGEFLMNGLTVVLAGFGPGVVTATAGSKGIDCGTDCNEVYPNGTTVTLSQRALAGGSFVGWTGPCVDAAGDCVVTTDAVQTVTATFDCAGTSTYNYTGGLQSFTPPACATLLRIDAQGAQGGLNGGLGARVAGDFTPNGTLTILVGGAGVTASQSGGGGGGTFVYKVVTDAAPLLAAGGGGGMASNGASGGGPGSLSPSSSIGGAGNAAGGANANGGSGGTQGVVPTTPGTGGGGAGWVGNGLQGNVDSRGGGGLSPRNGGTGGIAGNQSGGGGYGGGGGGAGLSGAGGGGGGYAGGGGGNGWGGGSWGAGGGGGSFNGGANTMITAGTRAGNGIVTITWSHP